MSPTRTAPLCDLHVHLYGSIQPHALLEHLASRDAIPHWDWYESQFEATYGFVPATRQLVERYRAGDDRAVDEFRELAVMSDSDSGSFAKFAAKANLAWVSTDYTPHRLGQDCVQIAELVRDDLARHGVAYAEQRTFAAAPEALLENFLRQMPGRPVLRAVANLPRVDPLPVWEQVKELLLGPSGEAIVAVDFSGIEEGHPPRDLAATISDIHAFNAAQPHRSVAILDHVGESFTDKSLESAIRWVQEVAEMGVHRLGHATALGIDPDKYGKHTREETVRERRDQIAYDITHAEALHRAGIAVDVTHLTAEDEALARRPKSDTLNVAYDTVRLDQVRRRQEFAIERVRATGAVVEVCPTSNRRIGGISDPAHHPLHRFINADLPVVVSTDDPGVFDITLQHELDWVCTVTNQPELHHQLAETAWRSRSELLSGRIH